MSPRLTVAALVLGLGVALVPVRRAEA